MGYMLPVCSQCAPSLRMLSPLSPLPVCSQCAPSLLSACSHRGSQALSGALKLKTAFTAEEWAAFGIGELHLKHFIQSGSSYFTPFEIPEGFLPSDRWRTQSGALRHFNRAVKVDVE